MPATRARLLTWVGASFMVAAIGIGVAVWLRTLPAVQAFVADYPGTAPLPAGTPVGIPAWLNWSHYLNAFMLVLIVRTGWIIRSKRRPPAFWTRHDRGLVRFTGRRQRLGIYHWLHLCLDAAWVLNGIAYVVLLWVTGQWLRIVPTDWSVLPNAISALLQYASLDWPVDNPWVFYNALQQLSYFTVVFVLSPLAILTGLRLSPAWPLSGPLTRMVPERLARRTHALVLYAFVAFIVVHVGLVFATGALRNLNVMYAANDGASWLGAAVFGLSVLSMVGGWLAATPAVLKRLAAVSGEVR